MKMVHASVGIRNGKQCYNVMSPGQPDQQNVMELLNKIPEAQGGSLGPLGPKNWPAPQWGICSPALHAAILRFQEANRPKGLSVDGHIDPGGKAILLLNQLAGEAGSTSVALKLALFWLEPERADVTDQVAYAREVLAAYDIGVDVFPSTSWSAMADLTFPLERDVPNDVELEGLAAAADRAYPHGGRVSVIVMQLNRFFNAFTVRGLSFPPLILLNGGNFGHERDNASLVHELNNAAGGNDNEVPGEANIARTPAGGVPRTILTPAQVQRLKAAFFAR